jgi:hypothetical protein
MYRGIANGQRYLDLEALGPSSSEENKFNLLNEELFLISLLSNLLTFKVAQASLVININIDTKIQVIP